MARDRDARVLSASSRLRGQLRVLTVCPVAVGDEIATISRPRMATGRELGSHDSLNAVAHFRSGISKAGFSSSKARFHEGEMK